MDLVKILQLTGNYTMDLMQIELSGQIQMLLKCKKEKLETYQE